MKETGKVDSTLPKYPGTPSSGKEGSGEKRHERMNTMKKVETLKGFPTTH